MLDDQLRRSALVLAFACAASWTHASELALWTTGDCVKVAPECPAEARNYHWDGANRRVTVAGARGEVVAFQIVLQAKGEGRRARRGERRPE